jgi:hypothetical protein
MAAVQRYSPPSHPINVNNMNDKGIEYNICSANFLKKISSRMYSDPQFGWRGGGVSYIDKKSCPTTSLATL